MPTDKLERICPKIGYNLESLRDLSVRPSITDQTFLDVDFFCALIGFKSKNYIEKVTFIDMLLRKVYRVLRYLEKFSMKIRSTGLPYTISLIGMILT